MKFPLEVFDKLENREKLLVILEAGVCDSCLGRQFGMLGHGMSNSERGDILRKFAEKIFKKHFGKPKDCHLCKNFFSDRLDIVVKGIVKKVVAYEFKTFLVGSVPPDEMKRREESLWEKVGIEFTENLKSEINREVGKRIEKLTEKKFSLEKPDIVILVDLNANSTRLQIRSLYVFGKYQKLARGIPQTKWICSDCGGKGCKVCRGEGKLYKTSVQEIIEKPFLKAADSNKSAFHGGGREDIDARNLGWRPFVIEVVKPMKRKIDLKKTGRQINKSKKVNVKGLRFVDKDTVRKLKSEKIDKTYLAEVEFSSRIDKSKLKNIKSLMAGPILQKTPLRVVHRRADKFRKRLVKKVSWKVLGDKKLQLKVKAEAGLYIKELISGDEGRTRPSVSDILDNKVKKISLDVIKIHTK